MVRRIAAVQLLALLAAGPAAAAPGLMELFEGPTTSWRLPVDPAGADLIAHERVRVERHGEQVGAERVQFRCPAGFSGVFLHPIGQAPVLDDLSMSLVYRGDSPGARLAARVVFPRAENPRGEGPLTSVVRGEGRYETPGQWATLTVEDLPLLVKRQTRLLRAEDPSSAIDQRGAYVDSVVLIVPGGPSASQFWVERLAVDGAVNAEATLTGDSPKSVLNVAQTEVRVTSAGFAEGPDLIFPRVWSSHGEDFQTLKKLGFNAVALEAAATSKIRSQAKKTGLRLIAPPPEALGDDQHLWAELAWMLPPEVDRLSIDAVQPIITRVRQDPRLTTRPLLAAPVHGFAAWSRLADALVLPAGGPRLGTAEPFAAARAESLPGTPAIARIRTDYSPESRDQFLAFAPTGKARTWRPADAIESAVWRAVAAGAKGVWLEADAPLAGAGEQEQAIAAAIELLNLKLAALEPWLVGGERVGEVLGRDRQPVAALLRRGRTRLVVGYRREASPAAEYVIPAVTETSQAYQLTPAGLAPLQRKRTLGGVSIEAGALGPGEFVLLTDDRRAVRDIQTRLAQSARRAVELQQEVLLSELSELQLSFATSSTDGTAKGIESVSAIVTRQVSRSKAAAAAGDRLNAYLETQRGRQVLRTAKRDFLQRLVPADQLDSSPLTEVVVTWGDELRLRQLLRALPRSGNLLAGGDFEDLEQLRSAGWRHTTLGDESAGATVELSPENPLHGEKCLLIRGAVAGAGSMAPAAWITSPPTTLAAGRLVEITGWVRFVQDEGDAAGALAIIDSLGGEELAIVVDEPGEWRRFRLLRRPTKRGELRVSFALSGAGSAAIDAVMVRPITLATPQLKSTQLETASDSPTAGPADYMK